MHEELKWLNYSFLPSSSPLTLLLGVGLSETHQGAASEGQTYLCQHVRNICREGLKGEACFYSLKPELTGKISDIRLILWLCFNEQKDAERVKTDNQQKREEAMEIDKTEKDAASKTKA